MDPSLGLHNSIGLRDPVAPAPDLNLLPAIEPWGRSFRRNLTDALFSRQATPPAISSQPGVYWHDVFVNRRLPWRCFAESGVYHLLALALVYGFSLLPARPAVTPVRRFDSSQVVYFSPSEYLPPLDTGNSGLAAPRKPDPELARQPILSVPPEARNREQTIVSPPDVQLANNVATPNIVAWGDHSVPVPVEAAQRASLTMASLNQPVVAPAPTVIDRNAAAPSLSMQVVAPPPDASLARASRPLDPAHSEIIAPPPSVAVSARRMGQMNIAPSQIIAPAPQLAVSAQRVPTLSSGNGSVVPPPPALDAAQLGSASAGAAHGSRRGLAQAAVIPPPPSAGSATSGGASRLIALGIHPAAVAPPAAPGNRQGEFAASPEGRAGATGTPGANADPNHGRASRNSGGSGTGAAHSSLAGVPSGLQVGHVSDSSSTVAGFPREADSAALRTRHVADASPGPSIPSTNSSPTPTTELERKVFGDRPFYSMTLNLPNLNSAGGSWIMRFAELNDSGNNAGISAPQALHKVDPAYPIELMRRNVTGTVAVRAVIRSDGTVADVQVVRSVDERLDRYACEALSRWQFSPATREGTPVDLAVLVMIPFKPVRPHSLY